MRASFILLPVTVLATNLLVPAEIIGQPRPKDMSARTIKAHDGFVLSVHFMIRGDQLASAGRDRYVYIWDPDTGKKLSTLKLDADRLAYCVAFSSDYRFLASAGGNPNKQTGGSVTIWDVAQGKRLVECKGHKDIVGHVAFRPDGKQVASASYDKTARLWDAQTGKEQHILTGHASIVYVVAYNPAGDQVASGGADWQVILWNPKTGKELKRLKGHTKPVTGAAFSPDGKRLATSGDDKVIRV
jgi:WD40 repeat protein